MAQMLQQIRQRAQAEGLDLQFEVDEGQTTRRVTWVDDLALSVQKPADQVVTATASLMSIILDEWSSLLVRGKQQLCLPSEAKMQLR